MNDVKTQLRIPSATVISESFDRPNIFYSVYNSETVDKYSHIQACLEGYENQSVIVYGRKNECECECEYR